MPVTLIDTKQSLLTVVVIVTVQPDRQNIFLERLEKMVESFTRHRPGFLSSALHASQDGGMVINYSQWRDKTCFDAFRDHPEAERHIATLRKICDSMDARIMEPCSIYSL